MAPLPSMVDLSRRSGSPFTPAESGTPGEWDDERPRKRSRTNGTADPDEGANGSGPGQGDALETGGAGQGKKPGGSKKAQKGQKGVQDRKPRTVVRVAGGIVPMEIDADGNQHRAGRLPDSAVGGETAENDEEAEEEDIPLAKRPELDDAERRRREVIKEKEREKENELLRGTNVEEGAEGDRRAVPADVDIWEGVELVSLAKLVILLF